MNELEAKCYLTKQGGANNSDHTCRSLLINHSFSFAGFDKNTFYIVVKTYFRHFVINRRSVSCFFKSIFFFSNNSVNHSRSFFY